RAPLLAGPSPFLLARPECGLLRSWSAHPVHEAGMLCARVAKAPLRIASDAHAFRTSNTHLQDSVHGPPVVLTRNIPARPAIAHRARDGSGVAGYAVPSRTH